MAEINNINSIAREIVSNLDKQDGKEDGKIEASIWNKFVCEKQGNEIHNYISTNNAVKSVIAYLKREVAKTGQAIEDVANEWLKNVGGGDKSEIDFNEKGKSNLSVKYPIIDNLRFDDISNDNTYNTLVKDENIKNNAQRITENATQLLFDVASDRYRYNIKTEGEQTFNGKKMCVRKIELKDGREIEVHLIEKDNGKYEIDMANGFWVSNSKDKSCFGFQDSYVDSEGNEVGAFDDGAICVPTISITDGKNETFTQIDNETLQSYLKIIQKIFGDDIEV